MESDILFFGGEPLKSEAVACGGVACGELVVEAPWGTFKVRTALSERERRLLLCGGLLASL